MMDSESKSLATSTSTSTLVITNEEVTTSLSLNESIREINATTITAAAAAAAIAHQDPNTLLNDYDSLVSENKTQTQNITNEEKIVQRSSHLLTLAKDSSSDEQLTANVKSPIFTTIATSTATNIGNNDGCIPDSMVNMTVSESVSQTMCHPNVAIVESIVTKQATTTTTTSSASSAKLELSLNHPLLTMVDNDVAKSNASDDELVEPNSDLFTEDVGISPNSSPRLIRVRLDRSSLSSENEDNESPLQSLIQQQPLPQLYANNELINNQQTQVNESEIVISNSNEGIVIEQVALTRITKEQKSFTVETCNNNKSNQDPDNKDTLADNQANISDFINIDSSIDSSTSVIYFTCHSEEESLASSGDFNNQSEESVSSSSSSSSTKSTTIKASLKSMIKMNTFNDGDRSVSSTQTNQLLKHQSSSSSSLVKARKRTSQSLMQSLFSYSYKRMLNEFHRVFEEKDIPRTELLIGDYACAYSKEFLIQGRLYFSRHYVAFHANLIGLYERRVVLRWSKVQSIAKAYTMMVIPNAIHITTVDGDKHVFASFVTRDRTYEQICYVWQHVKAAIDLANTTLPPPPSPAGDAVYQHRQRASPPPPPSSIDRVPSSTSTIGSSCDEIKSSSLSTSFKSVNVELSTLETPPINESSSSSATTNATITNRVEAEINDTATTTATNEKLPQSSSSSSSSLVSTMTIQQHWDLVREIYGTNLGFTDAEEKSMQLGNTSGSFELSDIEIAYDLTQSNVFTTIKQSQLLEQNTFSTFFVAATTDEPEIESSLIEECKSDIVTEKIFDNTMGKKIKIKKSKNSNTPEVQANDEEGNLFFNELKSSSNSLNLSFDTNLNNVTSPNTPTTLTTPAITSDIVGKCNCPSHFGTEMLNKVFDLDIQHLYELLYANEFDKGFKVNEGETFMQELFRSRQTYDISCSEWNTLPDVEQKKFQKHCNKVGIWDNIDQHFSMSSVKKRTLKYTVQLNMTFAKASHTREQQYLLQYEPGVCFVIHSEASNEGVPMSDTFLIHSSWCFTNVPPDAHHAKHRTRVVAHFQVTFVKSGFSLSMLKSTIEKSSFSGFNDFVNILVTNLERYIERFQHSPQTNAVSTLNGVNQMSSYNNGLNDNQQTNTFLAKGAKPTDENHYLAESETNDNANQNSSTREMKALYIIGIVLIIMTIINLIMVYRLTGLETEFNLMMQNFFNEFNGGGGVGVGGSGDNNHFCGNNIVSKGIDGNSINNNNNRQPNWRGKSDL